MTRKAQEHLRNAFDILERVIRETDKALLATEAIQAVATLGYAAEDVLAARKLDPDAQITVENKLEGAHQIDCDLLAGRLLFKEGVLSTLKNIPEEIIWDGIAALKHHLAYRPYHAIAYVALSEAYTRVYERALAIEAAEKALELDPLSLDARQLNAALDNPVIGVREVEKSESFWMAPVSALLVVAGIVLMFLPRGGDYGLLIAIIGGVMWFVDDRRKKNEIQRAAFDTSTKPVRTL